MSSTWSLTGFLQCICGPRPGPGTAAGEEARPIAIYHPGDCFGPEGALVQDDALQAQSGTCTLVLLGPVYTVDPERPWAEGIAVVDGRIARVGTEAEVLSLASPGTRVIRGALVLPGFHDAHCHHFSAGLRICREERGELCLIGLDLPAILEQVRLKASTVLETDPIFGTGFDRAEVVASLRKRGISPCAALEEVAPGRTVVLFDSFGRCAWATKSAFAAIPLGPGNHVLFESKGARRSGGFLSASSAGLVDLLIDGTNILMAGLPRKNVHLRPDGVSYEEDDHGNPIGMVFDPWCSQLGGLRPPEPSAFKQDGLLRGLTEVRSYGITAVSDALITEQCAEEYGALFASEAVADGLPRVSLCLRVRAEDWTVTPKHTLQRLADLRAKLDMSAVQTTRAESGETARRPARLVCRMASLEVCGAVAEGRALMLGSYGESKPSSDSKNGVDAQKSLLGGWQPRVLRDAVRQLAGDGWSIHCRVPGEGAPSLALDALEAAEQELAELPSAASIPESLDRRNALTHLHHVESADISRFKRARCSAVLAPHTLHPDFAAGLEESNRAALGEERFRRIAPLRELQSKVLTAFGSDWDVIRDPLLGLSPLAGIEAAVTHRAPGCSSGEVWCPEGRISLEEAVRMYTLDAARTMFLDRFSGSIIEGKCADIVVLESNLWDIPSDKIHTTKVEYTIISGRVVSSAASGVDK